MAKYSWEWFQCEEIMRSINILVGSIEYINGLIDNFGGFSLYFQMYGRYTKDLGECAKAEARKLKMLERRRKKEDKDRDRVRYTLIQL